MHPGEDVSWYDTQDFITELSKNSGELLPPL
jgi:hypothetical protein